MLRSLFALLTFTAPLAAQTAPLPDSKTTRALARAVARHVCQDSTKSLRVVPLVVGPGEPLVPDIAPGVLGAFFTEVASACRPQSAPNANSWRIELVRLDGQRGTAQWRVASPLVGGQWSTDLWEAALVWKDGQWVMDRAKATTHNVYFVGG